MGMASGDIDGDGWQDLYVSHYSIETNTLYRSYGPGHFEDATNRFGLSVPSFNNVGWGGKFLYYDNLQIKWPDGCLQKIKANEFNRYLQVHYAKSNPD